MKPFSVMMLLTVAIVVIALADESDNPSAASNEPASTADSPQPGPAAQRSNTKGWAVFHDLRFSDGLEQTGIRFDHRLAAETGDELRAFQDLAGNGISVADVDGDGHVDLYFATQAGPNHLWRNLGRGRFENSTEISGAALADRSSIAGSFGDIDNDGDPDLLVTTLGPSVVLLENDGEGRFQDITAPSGLSGSGRSSVGVFLDVDLDGLLDLFLAGFDSSRLYRNAGKNRFDDVTDKMGLGAQGSSLDATFADLNGDLYPDLYVVSLRGGDRYWQNVNGEKFTDRTIEMFGEPPSGSTGADFFDFDQNGHPDLVVTAASTADPGAKSVHVKPPAKIPASSGHLWVMGDGPTFQDLAGATGATLSGFRGGSIGDLNADGFPDLLVLSTAGASSSDRANMLLLNEQGQRFRAAEFLLGIEPRPGIGTTDSSVFLDVDGDQDLDIVTLEIDTGPRVLLSNQLEVKRNTRYLFIKLQGTRSNRDGLGATVTVTVGDKVNRQYFHGKTGHLSHGLPPLYFGLGDYHGKRTHDIEVRWPSGIVQKLGRRAMNTVIEIVEEDPSESR